MKKLFLVVFLCTAFLFVGNTASAIPTLGVAPGFPGSSGTYLGSSSTGDYLQVFADTFLGTGDGFSVPSTGSFEITIWYGSNDGAPDYDQTIWLATDAADGGSFTFNNAAAPTADGNFILDNDLSVSTYKPDTFGVSLGSINSNDDWSPLNLGEFGTGSKEFWYLQGTIDVGDSLTPDEWLYAVAVTLDSNNFPTGVTDFSPPTSSSTVPEPTTMLLLGAGLVGLAGFGRKRFKK